jgi:hypothetical protein
VLSGALVTGATVVQAKPSHPTPNNTNTHSKRCAPIKRGFTVSGDTVTASPTKNTDGSYSGTLTFTARHANRAAKKSGVVTLGSPVSLTLANAKVTFEGGITDFTGIQPTDKVKAIGKISYTKKGGKKNACTNPGYDTSSVAIRKVVVIRPSA